jgi:hypothetical protein
MNKKKFKDLVFLSDKAEKLPNKIILEGMDLDKYIYLQDDTLNPVILSFSNFISVRLFNKEAFNLSIVKKEKSLCFAELIESKSKKTDYEIPESIKALIIMESFNMIFNHKNKKEVDLTQLVTNWRTSLNSLQEGEEIDFKLNINSMIINNINYIKYKNEENKNKK